MHKLLVVLALLSPLTAVVACSDDDGSDVVANLPPGAGSGGSGGSGPADAGLGGDAGTSGSGGSSGAGGGGGGPPGCSVAPPDAGLDAGSQDGGLLDAGALDAGALDAGGGDASVDLSGVVSFAADIHPIFEASCGPCHVDLGYAGHNVGGDIDAAYQDAVALGQSLLTRIDGGGMPPPNADPPNDCGAEGRGSEPGDPGCLSVAEVALVRAWIEQCQPR